MALLGFGTSGASHDPLLLFALVAVAAKFSRDGAGRSAKHPGYRPRTTGLLLHRHYNATLFRAQLLIPSRHVFRA